MELNDILIMVVGMLVVVIGASVYYNWDWKKYFQKIKELTPTPTDNAVELPKAVLNKSWQISDKVLGTLQMQCAGKTKAEAIEGVEELINLSIAHDKHCEKGSKPKEKGKEIG